MSKQLNYSLQSPKKANQHLKKTFKSLDNQQIGTINKQIILSASMYTSDYYDRNIIEQQLQKCSNQISFTKFQQIFQRATVQKQDNSSKWIFKLYDKQKKGFIDQNDLRRASQITGVQISQQQIYQMLKGQNQMVQGKIYFEDFAEIMKTDIQFQ